MERYIIKDGKKLRYGYTTGSCATAASKAAAQMLLQPGEVHEVDIDTPKGWSLKLKVEDIQRSHGAVSCAIIKDAGDDPDVTNKLAIYSKLIWRQDTKIEIHGGEGVGTVTRPGLQIPVGKPAINPIPLQMIEREVREVIGPGRGVDIVISVPKGQEVAKKTFNPKLGIQGGISILGTSGIVEPMSEEAMKDSLALELPMAKAEKIKTFVFVPGNYGRDMAREKYKIHDKNMIKISNFVGFMMDQSVIQNVERILIIGHIGKLVKVAGGIFHTHSKVADGRREILAAHLAALGASQQLVLRVLESNTTEEAVGLIQEKGFDRLFSHLADKITEKCVERTQGNIEIGTIIFSMEQGVLAHCSQAGRLLEILKSEGVKDE
ncbi:cobalamin biosynthesis protein CbiD [Alkaliphilus metalliredigens QYMF]|uniref:Cobalt-precorrin-5B C(1)-methyltransferase n=1 Tax=Alkaliphilus metalliredigens (strain QYMF) TaxID=293826 RepID=CBID_ALKMQ|nr:cobalt-precorrin-5B (C(1))-methyltransferase CbiD [Alkaliphilus metalliredigens]A6TJE5.1 RecName: Full=Cobalt-precorrin-5B C(1)-methyltransferase; AltName: Full=Cobalt-precorrin-6A synthase [Alkaliphilus metalliredigens QYMF]ABR46313.1 cobalamin biosynthesis protein CbiD [Alkaliphilus metalliredigens QYMF]